MARERVVVLDGSASAVAPAVRSADVAAVRRILLEALAHRGSDTRVVTPDRDRQAHCIGCFHCWVEEPGICRYRDRGADILRAIATCDTLLLLSPITFGGYSSATKQVLDRMLGLLLPDFEVTRGELAHPWRYARAPRLVGIGIAEGQDDAEAAIYRALVGRTARNLRARSHASVVLATDAPTASLRAAIHEALSRVERIPTLGDIAALAPKVRSRFDPADTSGRRALLLIGSPRQLSRSTSAVLVAKLGEGLSTHGWTSETVLAREVIRRAEGQAHLRIAAGRADLLVLAFPLYWDTPPYVLIRALEILAAAPCGDARTTTGRLVAVVNSSFPQAAQASLALAICARFAESIGFEWSGALALGSGAAIDGRPLAGPGRSIRPVGHVIRALDQASAALAAGQPVPAAATAAMAESPMRALPMSAWQRVYASLAGRELRRRASDHGIRAAAYGAKPYAEPAAHGPS